MTTNVIHKRRTKHAHLNYVYIGRGTRWGNPFVIGTHGDRAQGPPFIKLGRFKQAAIRYRLSDVHRWLASIASEVVTR